MRPDRKYEAIPPMLFDFDVGYFFDKYSITSQGWLTRNGRDRAALKRADGAWRVEIKGRRYAETALLWLRKHDYWPDKRVHFKNGDVDDCRLGNIFYEQAEDFIEQRIRNSEARDAYNLVKLQVGELKRESLRESPKLPHVRARRAVDLAQHHIELWRIEGIKLTACLELALKQLMAVEKDSARLALLQIELRQLQRGKLESAAVAGVTVEKVKKSDESKRVALALKLEDAKEWLRKFERAYEMSLHPSSIASPELCKRDVDMWRGKVQLLERELGIDIPDETHSHDITQPIDTMHYHTQSIDSNDEI